MNPTPNGPKTKEDKSRSASETSPEATPQREGGDDALAEPNPYHSRLDEKVIVNEQAENKVVNAPSQSEDHPSESEYRVDEI